jgi:hypothetical protein
MTEPQGQRPQDVAELPDEVPVADCDADGDPQETGEDT